MTALRMIVLATILIVGHIVEASGQTPSTLPPGMTQAQFDAMVDAISKAVADKLKKEGAIATPAPAPAAPPPAGDVVADQLAAFVDEAEHVFEGAPVLGSNLAAITSLLDESGRGGRSVRQFFLLLAVAAGVSLAAEPILRKTLSVFRRRLASGTAPERGLASLVNLGLLVVLDGLGVPASGSSSPPRWACCFPAIPDRIDWQRRY